METFTEDQSVISEERWRAWAAKGKLRDKANTRKFVVLVAVVCVVALLIAVYLFAAR